MARAKQTADEAPPRPDHVPGAPHPAETRHLFGQQAAERAFCAARASGRLAHGWLVAGPEGVGKATLAYRLARMAIAGDDAVDPPEACPVAARIRAGAEPGLRVLRRTVNDRTGRLRGEIGVDDVRGVKRFLEHSIPDGGWRAVIVDPADDLNRSSANALLKFLEEPPERTLILLVAHAPGGLLATIRSRCRRLDLAPLGPGDLAAALDQAGFALAPAEAEALAPLAGGSVGRAVRLIAADGLALYAAEVAAFGDGRLDRMAGIRLAEVGSGAPARDRARLALDLLLILLARLARAAVTGPPSDEAAPGEHDLMRAVAGHGPVLAEAVSRQTGASAHALAVNLDPGQVILDMLLDIDAALSRIRSR